LKSCGLIVAGRRHGSDLFVTLDSNRTTSVRAPRLHWHEATRPLALAGLALVSALGYCAFWPLVPPDGGRPAPFGIVVLLLALLPPYGAACWLTLAAPAPRRAGWRRAEWAVILGGALLLRAILLPLPPLLSPDAYRYVWDARLTAHGISPYLHGPSWPGFAWLRDSALYPRVPWKDVPTIYPPGAQLLYRLAYLIAPSSVWGIKGVMTAFDLLASAALMLLLRRRGKDPRQAIVYLWAPLVVVEFALSGHEDSAAIAFILLALLANGATFRGSRAVVGVLLGGATLVKLYPLVLVVALVRRRDWALLGGLALTVAAGYAPYWRDGVAALGFLSTYLTQVEVSYGGALLLIRSIGFALGLGARAVQVIGAVGALVGLGVIAWLRALGARAPAGVRLGPVGATAATIALWLAFSPHVFPWYLTALLPFCALYLALPLRQPAAALFLGIWAFCCLIPLAYDAFAAPSFAWLYSGLYVVSLALALGALAWLRRPRGRALGIAAPAAGAPCSAASSAHVEDPSTLHA
jgi:hypothetical protein